MRSLWLLAALIPGALFAQVGRIEYEQFTLPNGLRVIYSEDHSDPIVTVDVWYEVGSRNERPGRSGFAHLFEHMMFEGSAHVKKSEHDQLVERAGGEFNGSTAEDRTNYWETVPSNRLNLALWLEADRMRALVNQYFASVPSHAAPEPPRCDQPASTATRRREVHDAHANLDAVIRLYRVPEHRSADTPALEILNVILGNGESSRLNVTVVRRDKAAVATGALLNPYGSRNGPGIWAAYGIVNQGITADKLDSLLGQQVDSIRANGITADELAKAKNVIRAGMIANRETTLGKAEELHHYRTFHNALDEINTDLD